jgi:hypothetical protein
MRELVGEMAERLRTLDDYIRRHDQRIARLCQKDERCQRLVKVEGVGPLIATALVAAIGNARQFKAAASLVRGWDWCHVNTAAVSVLSCWVSASAATGICAHYSFTVPVRRRVLPRANETRAASG